MPNAVEGSRALRPWLMALLALAPALLLVLAAACGDDDEGGDDSGGGDRSATATEAPDGGSEETPSGDEGNGGEHGDDGDATTELKDLGKEWSAITARVTYQFRSTSQGETTETTMTFYSRPPDSRVDFEDPETGKAIFIAAGGKSYICSEAGGQGQCFSSPNEGGTGAALPFFGDFADPQGIDSAIAGLAGVEIDKFEEEIAGEDATCFKASGSFVADQGEVSWCFADDGLLLRSSFKGVEGSDEFSMEATDVSRDVSDDYFKPPFDVLDIGG